MIDLKQLSEKSEVCPKCGGKKELRVFNLSSSATSGFICPFCDLRNEPTDSFEKQDFQFFIKVLSIAYKGFCLNQRMHDKIKPDEYKAFMGVWDAILVALEIDYKLWLAKVLEEGRRPVCLKNHKFEGHEEVIKKIEKWRNEFFTHFDLSSFRSWEEFQKRNHLDTASVEGLFKKIIEIAIQYNKTCAIDPNLRDNFEQIKLSSLNECDDWLSRFLLNQAME